MTSEVSGRYPLSRSRNPFTCGLTGKTYTTAESHERSAQVAKALGAIMGWAPNTESPWDKVIGVFSFNTVQYHGLFEVCDTRLANVLTWPRLITCQ